MDKAVVKKGKVSPWQRAKPSPIWDQLIRAHCVGNRSAPALALLLPLFSECLDGIRFW
jgi:hypothetical protein